MSSRIDKIDLITEEGLGAFPELLGQISAVIDEAKKLKNEFKDVKSLVQLNNAIEETTENTEKLTNSTEKLTAEQKKLQKEVNRRAQLSKQRSREFLKEERQKSQARKKAIAEEQKQFKQRDAINKMILKAQSAERGSIQQLTQVNKILEVRMARLNTLIPEQAAQFIKLEKAVSRNRARMANMIVQNRAGALGFDRLGFSIQQVARELPSAAFGATIFFAAISNNLPILSDEIRRARREYEALTAAGKKATPVWRQILKSIFSWQTAMTVGITLLVLYGKEIGEFTQKLFKGRKEIDATAIAEKNLQEARKNSIEASANEIAKLDILFRATQDATRSIDERKEVVKELQRLYPEYLGNLKEEEILAGDATMAYQSLRNAIIEKAKAQAFANKIAENSIKIFELEEKLFDAVEKQTEAQEKLNKTDRDAPALTLRRAAALEKVKNEITDIIAEIEALALSSRDLEQRIDPAGLFSDPKKTKKAKDELKKFNEDAQGLLDRLIDAREAHFEKRLSQARHDNIETIQIEREKILGQLAMNEQFNELTLLEKQKLFTKLRQLDDEFFKEQSDRAISAILEQANNERIAISEKHNKEFQQSKKSQKDRIIALSKTTIKHLEIEFRAAQEILKLDHLTFEERAKWEQRLADLREQLAKEGINIEKKINDQRVKDIKDKADQAKAILNEGFALNQALNNRALENAQRRFELETALAGENKFKQLNAEKKFEREQAKIKRRQAIANKAAAASEIIINTAVAITTLERQTGIFGIPLIPLIVGIGALQLATVLAQPIPAFKEGGKHKGGLAEHSEGNKSELFIPEGSGTAFLTPPKHTISYMPAGEFIPADQTQRILAQQAINQTFDVIDMSQTNNHLRKIDKNTSQSTEIVGNYKIVSKRGLTSKIRI